MTPGHADHPGIPAPPALPQHIEIAQSNYGINSIGNDTVNIQNVIAPLAIVPMEQVDAPAGLGNLPHRAGVFVGREQDLDRVRQAMARSGPVVVTAVYGLGGVGKSTLAARYAALHRDDYCVVWWITADGPSAIETGLAQLAVALQPALAELPLEQQSEHSLRWLASHRGWLLILDNLEAPNHASAVLGRMPHGQMLITSRRGTGWHTTGTALSLSVLGPGDAVTMLTRIVTHASPAMDCSDAAELCAELGYLPLAIEQAAAYLAETGITPAGYLDLLAQYPAVMFQETAEGGDAERTMARIWRVTLDRLAGPPVAGQVLRVLAWYAPEDIPRALLTGITDEPALLRAIGRLAAYSMITIHQDRLGMHRLVQAVTRTPDPDDPHRSQADITVALTQATDALARALAEKDPEDPAAWPVYLALVSHVQALASHSSPADDTATTAVILNEVGDFLRNQGNVGEAITYLLRSTTSSERVLGTDHPDTLNFRNSLAGAHQSAGDLDRAIPLLEAVLIDVERVLGADHPRALNARSDLAEFYRAAGDLERAIPLSKAARVEVERMLGADHPDTLIARNNLAGAYQSAGDLERAIPLYEAALVDLERVRGADHPDTLTVRHNLAGAYRAAGDLERAIPLHEAVLADRERVLGTDHPDTLDSRNSLAGAYRSAGDLERAIPLYEAALVDLERVLGTNHPTTKIVRSNLRRIYGGRDDC